MEQRVTLITLGVADVERSKAFYERLGWRVGLYLEETAFFQIGDSVLTLWGRDKLAQDSGVTDGGGWGGVTLAHNVGSPEEVRRIIEEARAAGARISREPAETFYGGFAGVFLDPDGHPWEIAHNPGFELGADGSLKLPSS
jgi:catechol 2,3-dioxygenase-like lactoylglutathione lyase family enzyme